MRMSWPTLWLLGCGTLLSCGGPAPEEPQRETPLTARRDGLSQIFTQQTDFTTATGAALVTFPGSAYEAYPDHPSGAASSCTRGPSGIDLPWGASAPTLNLQASSVATTQWFCFIGPGWNHNNTHPSPVKPTITVSGEDDFELAFLHPVSAVGLELLTNQWAQHKVTLTFTDGTQEVLDDTLLDTAPNAFEFVGIQASKRIRSVVVDTTGGARENEGIAGIWVAP